MENQPTKAELAAMYERFGIAKIARITGLGYSAIQRALHDMAKEGILKMRKRGRPARVWK